MRCGRLFAWVLGGALVLPAGARAEGSFYVAGLAARDGANRAEAKVLTSSLRATLEREGLLAELPGAKSVSSEDARRDHAEVEKLIKQARDAYDELDHKACIQAVTDALQKHDRTVAYHRSSTTMADGLLLMAQALEKSGQPKKARPLYLAVVSRWPDHQPDPNAFPPTVTEALQRARTEVDGAAGITLTVESTPPGATVFLDGVERGPAPLSQRVGRTRHFLRLERDGAARTVEVNLEAGGSPKVVVEMDHPAAQASERLLAALTEKRPEAQLRKAAVAVGKRSGAMGVLAGVLLPGRHVVLGRFDAPQGAVSRVVEVRVGTDSEADETLGRLVGELTAASAPKEDAGARRQLLGAGVGAAATAHDPAADRPVDATPTADEKEAGGKGRNPWALASLGLLAVVPAGAAVVLALAGASAAGGAAVAFFYFNPPNPNGTDVKVNGTALTQ
ncbi:MAG: PEGA domain-containing protein [Deltaproteobacteria bacterium]|nr:PEGA domain-containing protein [Deltaproteobacteria bacterium]